MLAEKLLGMHLTDEDRIDRIVRQLTRELLSHDYVIGRREAKSIGLPLVDATDQEADLMWRLYEDVAQELKMTEPWNWEKEAEGTQPKTAVRALLESRDIKQVFNSTFRIKWVGVQQGGRRVDSLQITTLDEGWKKA